jgi:hypothetical protein
MSHGPDEPHVLPDLTEEILDKALDLMGYPPEDIHACKNCAPDTAEERIAAKLGGLFAVVQVHIAHRPSQIDAITGSYHIVRDHLGHGRCSCIDGPGADMSHGGPTA